MSRKKQKPSELPESESDEPGIAPAAPDQIEDEADSSTEPQKPETSEESPPGPDVTPSGEDLLEEVRRTLIEEETLDQEKQPALWRRVTRKLKKTKKAESHERAPEVKQQPPVSVPAIPSPSVDQEASRSSDVDLVQIEELMNLLETEQVKSEEIRVEESPRKPDEVVDLSDLKKQAFHSRAESDESENLSEVRSIILEGGEEVFVEVESKPQDAARERMDAFQNALRPYHRYIYFMIAFLGLIAVVISGIILFNAIQPFLPAEPVDESAILPYPTGMTLPGGLEFTLGRGVLDDGQWNPKGPEWLEGTEICRWIAIPWSRQMEAVIRTLNANDPIELTMSNNDQLEYHVYSVQEVRFDELQSLETDTPCLLLVLAKSDTEMRWVLTALP